MMNFNNILKNKYLYYLAVALMMLNVLGYVSLGSIECVLVLGGAAYIANHFTKNRTADIFIGLFVSNILFGCGRLKEGFDTGAKLAEKTFNKITDEAKVAALQGDVVSAAAKSQAAKHVNDALNVCNDDKCKKKTTNLKM
uniref:Uncharacterized protein n=1 Tax=viral metagenome TaxID=1070528 RepID=A0A6C0C5S0_9ZZZZ